MRRISLLAITAIFLAAIAPAMSITCIWTNIYGGSFGSTANWSPRVPLSGDDAVISVYTTPLILLSSGNYTINSLACDELFQITGGSLTTNAVSAVNLGFYLSGGTFTPNADFSILGAGSWTGGDIYGIGQITNKGVWSILDGSTKKLWGKIYNNSNIVHKSAIDIAGGLIKNNSGATFDIQTDTGVTNTTGSGKIDNYGAFKKSGGTGISDIVPPFNSYGSVYANSGTLRLLGGGLLSGNLNALSNSNLTLQSGTYTTYDTLTMGGGGSVSLTGGTLNLAMSTSVNNDLIQGFKLAGGTITGNGLFYNRANMDWSTGSFVGSTGFRNDSNMTITGYASKTIQSSNVGNNGTITHSGTGYLNMSQSSEFHNWPGALYEIQNDARFLCSDGTCKLFNSGTIRKTTTTGLSIIEPYFDNRGTLDILKGSMIIRGGGIFVDSDTNIDGALTIESGNYSLYGYCEHHGYGSMALTGGTYTMAEGATVHTKLSNGLTLSGITVTGHANLQVENQSDWSSGTIDGDLHFINDGQMTLSGTGEKYLQYGEFYNDNYVTHTYTGNVRLGPSSSFTNMKNSTYEFQTNAGIMGGGNIYHGGTFLKRYSTGSTLIQPYFNNNAGIVQVDTGTIKLAGGGYFREGGASVAGNANFEFGGGTFSFEGAYATGGSGSVVLSGGTLSLLAGAQVSCGNEQGVKLQGATITGPGSFKNTWTWNWSSGGFTGTARPSNLGTLNLIDSYTKTLQDTQFYNSGTIVHSSDSVLAFSQASRLDNIGTYEFRTDGDITSSDYTNVINNTGTFKKTYGTGITNIQVPFNNQNIIEVQTGTFRLSGGGPDWRDSSANVFGNALFELSSGSFNLNGQFRAVGDGKVSLTGTLAFQPGGKATFSTTQGLYFDSGSVSGSGTLYNTSTGYWNAGTLAENAWFVNQGTLTLGSSAIKYMKKGKLTAQSTIHQTGTGALDIDSTSTLDIWSGKSYLIDSDANITNTGKISNSGSFVKTAGERSIIEATMDNTGIVEVKSGTLSLVGQVTQCPATILTGGDWRVNDRCALELGKNGITENKATIRLYGSAQIPQLSTMTLNSGTLLLLQGYTFRGGRVFTNSGTLQMEDCLFDSGRNTNTGTWTGSGDVGGTLTNRGILQPDLWSENINISGSYSQNSTSTLKILISGKSKGQFGAITVGSTATLDGTLDISLINGFVPQRGDAFSIVSAKTRSGKFATITGAQLSNGLYLNPIYTTSGVILVAGDYLPWQIELNSVAETRSSQPDYWVKVAGVVSQTASDGFFIQDANRTAGIKVQTLQSLPTVGHSVWVVGKIASAGVCMSLTSAEWVDDPSISVQSPKPLLMIHRNLGGTKLGLQDGVKNGTGLNNVGLLTKITGKITYLSPNSFAYIDDGSGLNDSNNLGAGGTSVPGVRVILSSTTTIHAGYKRATVTGVSYRVLLHGFYYAAVLARSQQDIKEEY